jgi:hypothetical protein
MQTGQRTIQVARLAVAAVWAGAWVALLARLGRRAAIFTFESAIVLLLGAAYVTFAEHAFYRARAIRARR